LKITYPHMGNACIAIEAMLQKLKLEVIPPPPISKKTLEIGTKHCPEFACMPLKITMGNFIEALDLGADTILMAGGCEYILQEGDTFYCTLEEEDADK
jgi:predicted nucleotide-binding protein (sugar kinase/HSP70/actin superfamily)